MLTVFLYWPGLSGAFLVDDTNNLAALNLRGGVTNWETLSEFVFGNQSGRLGRPLSMLSFLIDDQYWPGSVESYRYTNLMLHCLCGVLIFAFTRLFVPQVEGTGFRYRTELSLFVMALWLFSPLHVSTTFYVVQRMTQLSAIFCVAGLCVFLIGRKRVIAAEAGGHLWVLVGLYFFGLLAVLSKENGALIFCFAVIVELTITFSRNEKPNVFILSAAAAPILMGLGYYLIFLSNFSHTSYRDFSIYERILTESRILWDYLAKIVFPISGKMSLDHDDIIVSKSLFEPISTIFSIIAHFILIAAAIVYRKRFAWIFLAVFGFYSGHLLESTVIPLELYYEHRNYFPSVFVFIGLIAFCSSSGERRTKFRLGAIALVGLSLFMLSSRATLWGEPALQTRVWAMEHPQSVRAQTNLASLLMLEEKFSDAQELLEEIRKKWPSQRHADVILLNYQCMGIFSVPVSGYDVLRSDSGGTYSGFLPSVTEIMMKLYRLNTCQEFSNRKMLQILSGLYELKYSKQKYNAAIQFWKSEVYANMGDLDGVISSLSLAIEHRKYSIYYYQKAVIFESASLYREAIGAAEQALRIERSKSIARSFDIERYTVLLLRLKAKVGEGDL